MKSIECSGKTVDDAVKRGLKDLGCSYGDVKIDILEQGSPGLFGLFGKLAKVRLTVKEDESFDFSLDMPSISLDAPQQRKKKADPEPKREEPKEKPAKADKPAVKAEPAEKPETKAEAEEPAEEAAPAVKDESAEPAPAKKPAQKKQRPPREKKPREPKKDDAAETAQEEQLPMRAPVELPVLDVNALNENEKRAYEFLSTTTKLMGVDVEIRMKEEDGMLTIQMTGDTLGILIGRRGETLDALQYLTSLTVNKGKEEYTRVSLDTENYRIKREETLQKLAIRMANRVRKTGRRVTLEPMNPYERRVLHSALQNNPYVTTHSEGEEPYRKVVITLK